MNFFIISAFLMSTLFALNSNGYMEFNLGGNIANGEYEKYNDDGFTVRVAYSNNINSSANNSIKSFNELSSCHNRINS